MIAAVAAQTGRPPAEIAHAVDASAISGNSEMVRYAQGLAALEDEIRIRLGHGPRRGPGATASHGPQDEKTWDSSTQDETPREETL